MPEIIKIYNTWISKRILELVSKFGDFSGDFEFQREAFNESTSIMTDSYIILQMLLYPQHDVIVYGGTAHIATLYSFLKDTNYQNKFYRENVKDRVICLDVSGMVV
jgi:hypothetical protein